MYNFGWIGTSFGISFLQNRRFSQQASWFREGMCHLCVWNDICCLPLDFLYRGNIELYDCPIKFWNYSGFVWPFYTLAKLARALQQEGSMFHTHIRQHQQTIFLKKIFIDTISYNMKINFKPLVYIKLVSTV